MTPEQVKRGLGSHCFATSALVVHFANQPDKWAKKSILDQGGGAGAQGAPMRMSHSTQFVAAASRHALSLSLRKRLSVHGIVQGVGFRPWVHRLAHLHGLKGYVHNSPVGVVIEIEGSEEAQQKFLAQFRAEPPPLASIDDVEMELLEPVYYTSFEIRESKGAAEAFTLVPPDIATCEDCLSDFRDPANRRYLYPFTNCTHCGPRYTIIRDVPYDRRNTTMEEFAMCADCRGEYEDAENRRFHAQPNACPVCGPWVELWDHKECVTRRAEAIRKTQQLLQQGSIVAIKGLGGFHLACRVEAETVRLLRTRKHRSDKPFALMVRDLETARTLAELSDADSAALQSPRRPIVLLRSSADARISSAVAPGIEWIGIMLPYTPLHHLLFDNAPYDALVMTSGNLSEEPIAANNEDTTGKLQPLADFFLLHNRKIQVRVDDSVVRTFENRDRVLRRSRGYAPQAVRIGGHVEQVLAVGGELKNVFCLTKDHYAVLSQHIGDLENLETLQVFEETLDHMQRFFRIRPIAVAHDLHPQYLSTRFAESLQWVEKFGVQHHHAHVASCMAENSLDEKVIGIALDGTGYGTDGKIWGGEFLIADLVGFERRYHFRYVPLAGGDAAVRQPWRSALAYLLDAGVTASFLEEQVDPQAMRIVRGMIAQKVNTIETSSCGRLFDAGSAILGLRLEVNYEGQAAMQLEAAVTGPAEPYPFEIRGDEIDFRETIARMVLDRRNVRAAASRFHSTLAHVMLEACKQLRASEGLHYVCLSGGTFQNFTLLSQAVSLLRQADFEVFLHARVPPNDGGLCLGQAAIANRILRNGKR